MDVKAAFGSRLRELRGRMNQGELATELGISRASVGYYENGTRTPDIEILDRVSSHFKVSYDYLLGRTDDPVRDIDDMAIRDKTGLSGRSINALKSYKLMGKVRQREIDAIDVINFLLLNSSEHTDGGTRAIVDLLSIYFTFKIDKNYNKRHTLNFDGCIFERKPSKWVGSYEINISPSLKEKMLLEAITEAITDVKMSYNLPDGILPGKDDEDAKTQE